MSIYSVAVLKLKTNWTVIYRHESTCICPQTLRSSENPRGEINDLCFLKHIPQALDEFPMRWVLIDIVIPVGGAVVLNYKGVGDATLRNSVFQLVPCSSNVHTPASLQGNCLHRPTRI